MPKIFISYRREDSQHQADRLHAALRPHVGNPKRDIFIDVDNIPVGVDFEEHLDRQVAQCDVLLALIGPGWLDARNPKTGKRRLDDPEDFVRIEIASALKRGIPVAPVLLDGAPIPAKEDLPEDLKQLARRNGAEVRRSSFDADADRMIRGLGLKELGQKPKPAAAPSRSAPPASGGWIAPLVALSMLALAGGGAWAWFANPGDWRGALRTAEADPPGELPSTADVGGGPTQGSDTAAAPATTTPSSPAAPAATPAPAAPDPAAEARAKADAAARDLGLRDEAAWGVARGADTRGPFDAYLRDFPKGAHATEARSRIAAFEAAAAERQRQAASAPAPAPASQSTAAPRAGETFRDCSDCPDMVADPSRQLHDGLACERGRA